MFLQRRDCFQCAPLGWVKERDVAPQNQIRLIRLGVSGALVQLLVRDGQNPETIGTKVIKLLNEIPDQNRLHRMNFTITLKMAAPMKYHLRRALREKLVLFIGCLNDHGHHFA